MKQKSDLSRRLFLAQSGAAATAVWLAPRSFAASTQPIKFGVSQITWGDDLDTALTDISALGYNGVQLIVKNLQASWMDKAAEVKAKIVQHGLTGVALSSGAVLGNPAVREEQLKLHMEHAQYARDAGILYLQLVAGNVKKRAATPDDYKLSGETMTEIGRRAAALGLKVSLHNHHGSLGQSPEQLDALMAASDPAYVKLELDIAHFKASGGDPVAAIDKYHDRLLFLHAKDVMATTDGSVRFVELGRGTVDIPAVFRALSRYRFAGWVIVELDKEETDPNRTPRESALISKAYIENVLKLHV